MYSTLFKHKWGSGRNIEFQKGKGDYKSIKILFVNKFAKAKFGPDAWENSPLPKCH